MNSLETQRIRDQYDNIAGVYDAVDWFIPSSWRSKATAFAYGSVLEVGVGTGLNLPLYTDRCQEIFGIDLSPRMLGRARERAKQCPAPVKLEVLDIQELPLAPGSFDCVLVAFVFCTVPDPVQGLKECLRVLKPGGKLILLEHMGSEKKWLQGLLNWLNPLVIRFFGDNINRKTVDFVTEAGFRTQTVENLFGDVVRLVVAQR